MSEAIKFEDRRYKIIKPIGSGGMGAVYHAHDRLHGRDVALKLVLLEQVTDNNPEDTNSTRIALANEFRTLASLRHLNIIEVLDYGFDGTGQPYFTMEYLQNAESIIEAAAHKDLEHRSDLVIQALQALDYLHRHGIVHRDLKPANILVQGQENVKLLDFGLAKDAPKEVEDADEEIVGTLAYIAPEVLTGEKANNAADLYAIGVILYEIFAEKHPYHTGNLNELINAIVAVLPDLRALAAANTDESQKDIIDAISGVVGRLLAKDPLDRYASAKATIEALSHATRLPLPEEHEALRESYLQGARFVGREKELNRLIELLESSKGGTTKTVLISGESGVGKSRLLDEIRIRGVVKGVSIKRGQEVSEARSPYQVWRDVVRQLLIYVDVSDEEASVLKPLVNDIDSLLGRAIPDAPPLEPPAAMARLHSIFEAVLRRYAHPMLIILQDLHWMGDESLALLQHIVSNVQDRPILILGGYRDDERPDLPKLLPNAEVIHLERFEIGTVAKLIHSMIGVPIEDKPILDFLHTQTEGNIFFLIETLRLLAEEAGNLENIASMTLPASVLSSGMDKIIRRRLDSIPANLHPYLQIAALIGRAIDKRLMEHISPELNYEDWLTICANAAVFDVQDSIWRFAHDKLREALASGLEGEQKQDVHRRIAEAIETVYGSTPATIANLAFHYHAAQIPPKAVPYLMEASNQMLATGLPRESLNYGLMAVRMLGVEMPFTPQDAGQEIGAEIGKIQALLAGRAIEELKSLPKTDNQAIINAIGIMLQIAPSANIAQAPEFYVLMGLRNFYLTLLHGNHMFSGAVYSVYASIFHINMSKDLRSGGQLAQLAVEIDEEWGRPMRSFILFVNQWLNLHWIAPLNTMPAIAAESSKLGFETNMFVFGCFSSASHAMWMARVGAPLEEVLQAARQSHETVQGRVSSAAFHAIHELQLAKAFMGKTKDPLSLSDDEFNEENDIAKVLRSQNVNQIAYYLWSKAMLYYLYGDSQTARQFAENTLPIKVTVSGQMLEWEFDFFYSLILLDTDTLENVALKENRAKFKTYAELNPATFGHLSQTIEAEVARVEGRQADAYALFDAASENASKGNFHLYAGLAQERKGKFALASKDENTGRQALEAAMAAYGKWGANAKVADVKSRYQL